MKAIGRLAFGVAVEGRRHAQDADAAHLRLPELGLVVRPRVSHRCVSLPGWRWRERERHSSQSIEELPGGRIRLTLHVVLDWELQAWVMGFGPAARVITPPAFAQRIVESLEETRATYLRTE